MYAPANVSMAPSTEKDDIATGRPVIPVVFASLVGVLVLLMLTSGL